MIVVWAEFISPGYLKVKETSGLNLGYTVGHRYWAFRMSGFQSSQSNPGLQ